MAQHPLQRLDFSAQLALQAFNSLHLAGEGCLHAT